MNAKKFTIYATCLRTGSTHICGTITADESGPIERFILLAGFFEDNDYQFELVEIIEQDNK